jgi:hypothetical protein
MNDLLDSITLSLGHGLLGSLGKLLNSLRVMSKILLASNKNDGKTLTEMKNLGNPLLLNVIEGIG